MTTSKKRTDSAEPQATVHPKARRGQKQIYPYAEKTDPDFIVLGKSNGMLDCQLNLPPDLAHSLRAMAERYGCDPGDIVNLSLIAATSPTRRQRKAAIARLERDRLARGLGPLPEEMTAPLLLAVA